MSLLLDALKKAAEDKKNKAGDKPDGSSAEEDLDLDLDMDETTDYPAVDKNLVSKSDHQRADDTAHQNASESPAPEVEATEPAPPPDDPQAPEAPATVDELVNQQSSDATPSSAGSTSPVSDTSDDAVTKQPEPELQMSIDQIIEKDRSQQDKEALDYLIHKSNQVSDSKKRRLRIMYGSLAGLIVLVLGIFSYLKLMAVSEQLFTGKPVEKSELRPKQDVAPKPTPQIQEVSRPKPVIEAAKLPEPVVPKASKSGNIAPIAKQSKPVKASSQSETQPIRIVYKKVIDPTDTYLRDAYRLFNAGEYQQARALYLRVLEKEPKNRDALLGVAAVDMKQDNFESARQKYMYLLQLNPKDSIARAGLSAMPSEVDPALSESQLKLMLREQPEAAHLYFALGNLYASANKWGEAQSAFFSAWSADSRNADYVFNLAVSLDHLGKYKQALEFYQKSLLLSNGSSANISREAIKTRIDFLQAQNE